jgi:hypothetical protein
MAVAFRFPSVLAPRETGTRTPLSVVPQSERRYVRVFTTIAVIVVAMGLVVALRAHMANQQMKIDSLNYDIERAALQSPEKLIANARDMGMVPSVTTRIIDIPAAVAAEVAATVGKVDSDVASAQESQLDEFGRLKVAVVGAP